MLYNELAGLEVVLQDKNLILPPPSQAQSNAVLCIAPIWEDDGYNQPPVDEGANVSFDAITITKGEDFPTSGLGQYSTRNPLARLWKQATDAGVEVIRVIRLHGKTAAERYVGLLNIFSVIGDYDSYDIMVVGGIYVDTDAFAEEENPTEKLRLQRAALLQAIMADEYVTYTSKEATLTETSVESGKYEITDLYVNVDSVEVPNDFVFIPQEDGTILVEYDGGATAPASVEVSYEYVADTDQIDKIDIATKLIKTTSIYIATGDVGEGKLVQPETVDDVDVFVLDLTEIDGFLNWSGGDIIVRDANGETALQGVSWTLKNTESEKSITFYRSPALYSVVIPTNSYFDFGAQVASFLETVNGRGVQALGVMSLKPTGDNSLRGVKEYVLSVPLLQYSKYLQVVGGPEQIFQLNGTVYKSTWEGAYAGMLGVLPSYDSPLNKPIPGVVKQDYQLSPMQSLSLTNKHVIVSRRRNNYIVCSDAITTAEDTSDFVQATTIRIVNDAISLVREIADPYIGKPNSAPMRAAMETVLKTGLEGMVEAGALTDFRFAILANVAEQLEGTLRIALELVPVFTMRKIRVSVAVRPSL